MVGLIGITCISLLSFYSNKLFTHPLNLTLFARILLTIVSITLTWLGNRYIILFFRERFSGQFEMLKRIAVTFLIGILYSWIILKFTAFGRYFLLYGTETAIELM